MRRDDLSADDARFSSALSLADRELFRRFSPEVRALWRTGRFGRQEVALAIMAYGETSKAEEWLQTAGPGKRPRFNFDEHR